MSKYIALYMAPAEAMAKMATATEEEKAAGMAPWMAWKDRVGGQMVDFGSPLMPGQTIDGSSNWSESQSQVTGYSIVEADNLDAAKALFNDHPHTSWTEGCSIQVQEMIQM